MGHSGKPRRHKSRAPRERVSGATSACSSPSSARCAIFDVASTSDVGPVLAAACWCTGGAQARSATLLEISAVIGRVRARIVHVEVLKAKWCCQLSGAAKVLSRPSASCRSAQGSHTRGTEQARVSLGAASNGAYGVRARLASEGFVKMGKLREHGCQAYVQWLRDAWFVTTTNPHAHLSARTGR
jgi:hypothetical protein